MAVVTSTGARVARVARVALAVLLPLAVGTCSAERDGAGADEAADGGDAHSVRARPPRDLLLPPEGEAYFGAFATMDESLTRQRFDEIAVVAGKRPAIHLIFRDWQRGGDGDFPLEFVRETHAMGAVAMVSWEPWWDYSFEDYPLLEDIASGRHDAYLRAFLEQAAKFDEPWFLRFAHEMEGGTYPWAEAVDRRQTAARYAAAFRHVADLARVIAPKTLMVWSPNSGSVRARRFWPGDESVDWIGGSLYNFPGAPQDPDHPDKLGGWMPMVRELGKPSMIAEMGCAESYTVTAGAIAAGGPDAPRLRDWMDLDMADKSACLERTFDVIERRYPDIRALVWFDIDKEGDADWRLDSSPGARATFERRIADPRYVGAPIVAVEGVRDAGGHAGTGNRRPPPGMSDW